MTQSPLDGDHHDVVVVGGGQAGLSISRHLVCLGIDHIVLEADRVGTEWRNRRWETFCLVTPNWQCDLPGFPYSGADPDGFMTRDEILDYLAAYRTSFPVPLVERVRVTRLAATRHTSLAQVFRIETTAGALTAEHVVIASGPYQTPRIPPLAGRLPTDLTQVHSSAYKSPDALPSGAVVVVGTGQSGCQIAEDLHLAGRAIHLFTGSAPRVSRFYRGRDVVAWLQDMGYYRRTVEDFDDADTARMRVNHYVTGRDGGRDIDLRAFAREGMRLYGKLIGSSSTSLQCAEDLSANLDRADAVAESIKDSIDAYIDEADLDAPEEARYVPIWQPPKDGPTELDLSAAGIGSVVWATGFSRDDSWIHVPVFDREGRPSHHRGVTDRPGLYFLGLPWQHTWGSGRFSGVGADAAHLADVIQVALRTTTNASAPVAAGVSS